MTTAPDNTGVGRTDVALPPRYDVYWRDPFEAAITPHLTDRARILDIGSGRAPSIEPARRPAGGGYVGLDISAIELEAAGPTAYDETVVASIAGYVPELRDRFDLAISWQVLEHVRPLERAAENTRRYLREGGTFVALLSGSFAPYALINRVLPDRIGQILVSRTMRRTPDKTPVFPAHYDQCHATGLRRAFSSFDEVTVTPFFRAANYFTFSRPLMKAYLAYENFICRRGLENLASHYLIVAKR